MQKNPSINFLKRKEKSFVDKLVDWAFTAGRAIIIITESIALAAFVYRFSLDAQIIDLRDKIKQQQQIITLAAGSEERFRNLQDRLNLAQKYSTNATQVDTLFNQIMTAATGRMQFRSVILSPEEVRMDADIRSAADLNSFITDLQKNPDIKSVNLDRIENKASSGKIAVIITAIRKAP